MLIELLEERPSLQDAFKDTAYKEIADIFGCNITLIKGKINELRAQYEREMTKVNKMKRGKSTDKLYVGNWAHYQSLAFLQPVMKSSSGKNTLKQSNEDLDEIQCIEVKAYSGSKKKSLGEKKIGLLTKCTTTNSTLIESQGIKRSAFATYVEEKLADLNKRQRTTAGKRINDALFELEMSVGN